MPELKLHHLLVLGLVAAPLFGQAPPRPRLPAAADTNSAAAYFQYGLEQLQTRPARAIPAFYWAERLDPVSPQIPYAHYTALLLSDRSRLVRYLRRDRGVFAEPGVRQMDSLMGNAVLLDPFVHRGLEQLVMVAYVADAFRRYGPLGTDHDYSDAQITYYLDTTLADVDLRARGLLAYSREKYADALRYWALAVRGDSSPGLIHAERARAHYLLGQYDSARADMELALRVAPTGSLGVWGYETRALWQYSLGRILERLHADSAAQAAYKEAVVEDVAYFPAHLRLGTMALARHDTAVAVREYEAAAGTYENGYYVQAALGIALKAVGRPDEAVEHLQRATQIEPFASAGWFQLATCLDQLGRKDPAVTAYLTYLSLAANNDPNGALAQRRLAALSAQGNR